MTNADGKTADIPVKPRRFLIVRLSAIGDTIHSLPLAAALKRLYPDCRLGWVVEKPSAPLILGNPLIDWTHVLPKGWLKSPAQITDLRRQLGPQRFDVAFDVQGLSKSAVAARLSGAPLRIGFRRGEARELAPLLDNRLIAPQGRHAVDITLSLLAGIGAVAPGGAEFVFPPCPSHDETALADFFGRPELRSGVVLMGPWGSFKSKLWPMERFLELAIRLRERTGLVSAMLGHGRDERDLVVALAAAAPSALIPAPDLSPPGVAELARRSRMFVGCDSFPMHAAAAVGCPTLGLFGVTDPLRLGPYGPAGHFVYERVTLVRSTRQRRRLGQENILALTVDKVFSACLEILGETAHG